MSNDAASIWKGNCHCGAFRFSLNLTNATLARENVVKCPWSLCKKKGCLWLPLTTEMKLEAERDEGTLVQYRAEGEGMVHEFCSICGTTVRSAHTAGVLAGRKAVNVRTLRGVDVFDYDHRPEITGDTKPNFPSPPLKGSCHCGKVTVEVLQPLLELEIKEDNCSICSRNAWLGIYPHQSQVVLNGINSTTPYAFGRKFNSFPFCSTCGVAVFQTLTGPPKEVVERLPQAGRERVRKMLEIQPVNVRCLEGVDVDALGELVKREDEGTDGYEEGVLGLEG